MAQIIAGMYEIQQKIGAGGGGIVYLGRHMRLNKTVVLKADKRKLSASAETLRREVDMLKNLSHTYIPQVYDFVQEGEEVYTVMDFIDGENLDDIIAREKKVPQPQLIQWACQLLEALDYLHKQPPYGILHGDIKPANIMLKPDGTICLIDYNIALALGEDGAVRVGFSRGYASPEHYGADYLNQNKSAAVGSKSFSVKRTVVPETVPMDGFSASETVPMDGFSAGETVPMDGVSASETVPMDGFSASETVQMDMPVQSETELLEKALGVTAPTVPSDSFKEYETVHVEHSQNAQSVARSIAEAPVAQRYVQQVYRAEKSVSASTGKKKEILLDARSDIYSLGATLYHLIAGFKPDPDARNVVPLGKDICSPAVSKILQKAMAPLPEDRYQSADEMLRAFRNLYKTDSRVVKHKRKIVGTVACMTTLFALGGVSTFIGLSQMKQRENALALAEYSTNALAEGDVSKALELALEAIPQDNSILNAPLTAQAQKALTDALGVYELSDGFMALDALDIPAAPFHVSVSPNGEKLAVAYAYETAVYDIETKEKLATIPLQESALADVYFVDDLSIVCAGADGLTLYDLANNSVCWKGRPATFISVSLDCKSVAGVYKDETCAYIYDLSTGKELYTCDFGDRHLPVAPNDIFADPEDEVFSLNADGTQLAVSFIDGGMTIFDLKDADNSIIVYDDSDFDHFDGGFYDDTLFAYTATEKNGSFLGMIDTQKAEYIGSFETQDRLSLKVDSNGMFLMDDNHLTQIDSDTLEETELAYVKDAEIVDYSVGDEYTIVSSDEKKFFFFDKSAKCTKSYEDDRISDFVLMTGQYALSANRNETNIRMLQLNDNKENAFFSYDININHDEARISADGKCLMLFNYKGFVIYGPDGTVCADVELTDADQIYDQQYIRDGQESLLKVIWYDGNVKYYSACDGSVVKEEKIDKPDESLYEELATADYRVVSKLHAAPEVYDSHSDKLLGKLESDDYLAYVTQVGDYLLTDYITTNKDRYGLLLNSSLETVAYLPNLCDVQDENVYFDDNSGEIKISKLYSIDELISMAEARMSP